MEQLTDSLMGGKYKGTIELPFMAICSAVRACEGDVLRQPSVRVLGFWSAAQKSLCTNCEQLTGHGRDQNDFLAFRDLRTPRSAAARRSVISLIE
jgi:hypothetical protein